MVLSVCCALGILLAVNWMSFSVAFALAGLVLGLIALALLYKMPWLRFVCLAFCFLFLGIMLAGLAAHPKLVPEGSYQVEGVVSGQSEWIEDGRRVKVVLRDVTLDMNRQQAGKAYWTWYPQEGEALPYDGQRVRFTGQVYHPSPQVNPQGFDFRAYLLGRGIRLGISGARELQYLPEVRTGHASTWLRLRDSLSARLDGLFKEQSGLAKALLLGVREGLDENVRQDFTKAGIAHVLAVSGLHVGFLVFGLLLLLSLLKPSPLVRLMLVAVFLLAYCRLLDFTPSVVRASILSLLLLSAKLFKRRVDPLTSLAAAFLLILLARPLDLMNLGFQLSFLAVLGIVLLGDQIQYRLGLNDWFQKAPAWLQKAITAYGITIAASLFTLVPLANAFHQVSLIGLLISPLAIALIGVLMGGFALCLLVSFVSIPLASLHALYVSTLSALYQAVVSRAAALPFAQMRLPSLHVVWTAAFYVLLFLATRYTRVRLKFRYASAALLAIALVVIPLIPKNQALRYIQLSTGFSDSALVLDGDTTFVIDTAGHGGDLLNLLLHEGRDIDTLFLTHLHMDHTGGLTQLLDSGIAIKEIVLPEGALLARDMDASLALLDQAKARGIPVQFAARGRQWQSDRVKVTVQWPYKDALYPGMDANRGSLVLYWELDGISLLTTGDLQADYAPYAMRPAQVVKLPHHGSRDDNTGAILRGISPRLALITAMEDRPERYQAALDQLGILQAEHAVTGRTGAITLIFDQGEMRIYQQLAGRE